MTDYYHCSICGNKLKDDEFEICHKCENKFGISSNDPVNEKIVNRKEKRGVKRYKGGIWVERRK